MGIAFLYLNWPHQSLFSLTFYFTSRVNCGIFWLSSGATNERKSWARCYQRNPAKEQTQPKENLSWVFLSASFHNLMYTVFNIFYKFFLHLLSSVAKVTTEAPHGANDGWGRTNGRDSRHFFAFLNPQNFGQKWGLQSTLKPVLLHEFFILDCKYPVN